MPIPESLLFEISRPLESQDTAFIDKTIATILDMPGQQQNRQFGHAVSLIRRHELYTELKRSRQLHKSLLGVIDTVFNPMPQTALEVVDVPVESVQFDASHKDWRNVVLVMGDPDNVLASERRTFMERAGAKREANDTYEFTMTLARISTEMATTSFLAHLSTDIPSTITLGPVNKPELRTQRPSLDLDQQQTTARKHSDSRVRTVIPTPQALLDSLRPKQ